MIFCTSKLFLDLTYCIFLTTELPTEQEPIKYVTQSGRATKRKLYIVADENSSDSDGHKKSKTTNKTKTSKQKKSEDDAFKITRKNKKTLAPAKHKLVDVDEEEFIETRKKIKPAEQKTVKKYTPLNISSPASYSEKMFDKLKDDNAKRKEQELERDRFLKTLEPESEEYGLTMLGEENEGVEDKTEKDDVNVTRRRIVPPNPFRKKLNLGLTKTKTENETEVSKEQENPTCPTCGKQFSISEINVSFFFFFITASGVFKKCIFCEIKIFIRRKL